MDNLFPMKGHGRRLMCLLDGDKTTELVSFPDGSFGIIQEAGTLSIWEPDELEPCVNAFLRIAARARPMLVMRETVADQLPSTVPTKPQFYN